MSLGDVGVLGALGGAGVLGAIKVTRCLRWSTCVLR